MAASNTTTNTNTNTEDWADFAEWQVRLMAGVVALEVVWHGLNAHQTKVTGA